MTFKERLIQAARRAGVEPTPTPIARSLGIGNRQTVHRWFDGSIPDSPMVFHIATTYQVSPAWLASGEGDMVAGPPADLSPPEREIVSIFRKLPKDRRDSLQAIVRALGKAVVLILIFSCSTLHAPPALAFNITFLNTHWLTFWRYINERLLSRLCAAWGVRTVQEVSFAAV